MRKTHPLSEQTIKVINGYGSKVADEYGCEPSYIYQILGQTITDPFAKFAWLFSASVRAGCDVSPWLTELDRIRSKYTFTDNLCHRTETAKSLKETSEAAHAVLTDEPLTKQLKEAEEAVRQAERTYQSVLNEINKDSSEVSSIRKFGREAVARQMESQNVAAIGGRG